MPVFEYRCEECGNDFEKLVFSRSATVACSGCGSSSVVRRPSTFGTSGLQRNVQSVKSSGCSGCSSGSCSNCSCG